MVTLRLSNLRSGDVYKITGQSMNGGEPVKTFEFPKSMGVQHDVMDPEQPYAKPDFTYPVLVRAILGR